MEEFKRQIIFVFIFVLALSGVVGYKMIKSMYSRVGTTPGFCIKVSEKLCMSVDFGAAEDYYAASTLCSQKGMSLPTLSDAWDIWISSENCKRAFSSNEDVPKNKDLFITPESDEYAYVPADSINNYCNKISEIQFPIASQYKGGMFWLKDSAGDNKHYAINYNRASIKAEGNQTRDLGVRCVYPFGQYLDTP